MGYPKFMSWVDASGEGVGGGLIPGQDSLETTIWLLEWPKKLRAMLVTPKNPGEDLDINYLEMEVKLLSYLVLEVISVTKNIRYKHAGLFRNNTSEVLWTQRGATKNFAAAGNLPRVLALRQ